MSGTVASFRQRTPREGDPRARGMPLPSASYVEGTRAQTNTPALTRARRVNGPTAWMASFGPFRLFPTQRLLLHADKTVSLGSRALDILIALVEQSGELLSKDELMARIWPNTFVDPGNLTVHISALRRALGDGCNGNRYIINIPGRGYQFVAAVTLPGSRADDSRSGQYR